LANYSEQQQLPFMTSCYGRKLDADLEDKARLPQRGISLEDKAHLPQHDVSLKDEAPRADEGEVEP